jgi:hypothetical protein
MPRAPYAERGFNHSGPAMAVIVIGFQIARSTTARNDPQTGRLPVRSIVLGWRTRQDSNLWPLPSEQLLAVYPKCAMDYAIVR